MARAVAAPAAAVLLLLGSACSSLGGTGSGNADEPRASGSDRGTASRRPNAPAGHRPVPSEGCRRPAPPPSAQRTFDGRTYLLKRPNNDGRSPAPLILDLHGLRSTAFAQALYGRMADTGAARGFIVVEPGSDVARQGWKLPGMLDGSADIAAMSALLDHLENTLCVDESRVFATGLSNGAGLATALICGLDGRLAGVAPVAGFNLARPCAGARPTTIVAFHGTADRIVPYEGGEPFGGDRAQIPAWMRPYDGVFALPSVGDSTAAWARAFRCRRQDRAPVGRGGEVTRLGHSGCADGVRVDLYTVTGGGHTWPGAFPVGLGRTTAQIHATTIILDAFGRR
jgi:polyhydroxybutyrate depolymerase